MKKFFIFLIATLFLITGCGSNTQEKILKDLTKKVDGTKGYQIEGELELLNNEDVYNYDVVVSYKKDNFYKVSLVNKSNNKEQIILRNEEGVYVVTPSLNKSFKFQSDWPNNNSQIYLLQSIVNDLNNDNKKTIEKKDNYYVYTSNVNYPNNDSLIKQKVYMDKNGSLKQVEVVDKNDIVMMKLTYKNIDLNANFDADKFDLDQLIDEPEEEREQAEDENNDNQTQEDTEEQQTTSLDDIIYPLYLPDGTKLTNEETIDTEDGKRVILTFGGDKSFILVEETTAKENEFTVIPTMGEPYMFMDTVGALSESSVTWASNGIDYYITSTTMNQTELLEIAKSISLVPTMQQK